VIDLKKVSILGPRVKKTAASCQLSAVSKNGLLAKGVRFFFAES